MKRIRVLSFIAFACVGFLAASACAGGQPDAEEASPDELTAQPLADEMGHPPPRPKPCESTSDCTNSCPEGADGCVCHAVGPRGEKACVPTCETDGDCPTPPDGVDLQCREGICVPDRPPPAGGEGPKPCDQDAACSGACPPGSAGCACHQPPRGGKICAPTCGTDADCPSGEGLPPLRCKDNFCVPPPPAR